MDVTMIGLQNAGKTSLLRVLAVCSVPPPGRCDRVLIVTIKGGEFTIE